MGTSEAVLQVFYGGIPQGFVSDPFPNKSDSLFLSKSHVKCTKKNGSRHMHFINCSSSLPGTIRIPETQPIRFGLYNNSPINRLRLLSCKCKQAESVSGITAGDGNGTWFVENALKLNAINDVFMSNGNLPLVGNERDAIDKLRVDSIEDEAWDLLRESMVYYCGSPIGTIAAKDSTSSGILNYDQVFIRDFIPSGIAFLLKGEYDIVRNFILHTLQLQVPL